jgi:hypothetical protein
MPRNFYDSLTETTMSDTQTDSDSRIAIERVLEGIETPRSAPPAVRAPTSGRPWPQLAGRRMVAPGNPDIYVIDPQGYRRCIPNHTTYNRLFRDWTGIEDETRSEAIAVGSPLSRGTILVHANAAAPIYLLDNGRRRLVRDALMMNKYWFNFAHVFSCRQTILDRLPLGRDWD